MLTRTSLLVVAGLVLIPTIAVVTILVTGTIQKETAEFRGNVSAIERTQASGAFRINAYEEFFNLCASVQAKENSILNLQKELSGKPAPEPYRVTTIQASITALSNSRAESIAQYNANAAKWTRGPFRDNSLPYNLQVEAERTHCVLA